MKQPSDSFDLIIAGSGFASIFFLHQYLSFRENKKKRVLILERGALESHDWKLKNRSREYPYGIVSHTSFKDTYVNHSSEKDWVFTIGVGGSSNCWWGCTPRFLPSDFRMKSLYGVGRDWPLSYEDLEPYYQQAEEIMQIAGPARTAFPRKKTYPLPAHLLNDFDRMMQAQFSESYFSQPCARPSVPVEKRPRCCASGVCHLCPIDAKFTILNSLGEILHRPNVTLKTGCQVLYLKEEQGSIREVIYLNNNSHSSAKADLVALGANALFNPHILLNSGIHDGPVGEGICEQTSIRARIYLKGINNFQGSTSITGHGYMGYDGPHRSHRAAWLMESSNIPTLRNERGRERQIAEAKFIFEDLPSAGNRVVLSKNETIPEIVWHGPSEYTRRSMHYLRQNIGNILANSAVERIELSDLPARSEAHILGTTVMGTDPRTSVIDSNLLHHRIRNLLLLGGGAFPTITPSNPTLTLASLSLRAANMLFS